jgi:hypothetical protein
MRASVTRAAEGFDRRSFTVDDTRCLREARIGSEVEHFAPADGVPTAGHARLALRHLTFPGVSQKLSDI